MSGKVIQFGEKKKEIEEIVEKSSEERWKSFVQVSKDYLKAISDNLDRHDTNGLLIIEFQPDGYNFWTDLMPEVPLETVVGALETCKLDLYMTLSARDDDDD